MFLSQVMFMDGRRILLSFKVIHGGTVYSKNKYCDFDYLLPIFFPFLVIK